jgi:hypothetical protein
MSFCGVVSPGTLFDGTRLRCQHEFGHGGDHSWAKHLHVIQGGITRQEVDRRAREGSPAALAILKAMQEKPKS